MTHHSWEALGLPQSTVHYINERDVDIVMMTDTKFLTIAYDVANETAFVRDSNDLVLARSSHFHRPIDTSSSFMCYNTVIGQFILYARANRPTYCVSINHMIRRCDLKLFRALMTSTTTFTYEASFIHILARGRRWTFITRQHPIDMFGVYIKSTSINIGYDLPAAVRFHQPYYMLYRELNRTMYFYSYDGGDARPSLRIPAYYRVLDYGVYGSVGCWIIVIDIISNVLYGMFINKHMGDFAIWQFGRPTRPILKAAYIHDYLCLVDEDGFTIMKSTGEFYSTLP